MPVLSLKQCWVSTGNLAGHEGRITSLSVAESGVGFCTTSWDTSVRVWY